jgi:hypothetical protein
MTAPGATAAFCDNLASGAQSGGRAGDLDDRLWSVARITGGDNSSSSLFAFPPSPVSTCNSDVSQVAPDNDILVCDAASGHAGQFLTALSAQNYAVLSLRPRQAFDFSGRTGTISYNVDAITEGPLSWWTSLFVTDEPTAGANNTVKVTGVIPGNGVGVNFDDPCNTQATQMRVNSAYVFVDYTESQVPLSNTTCVRTQRGSLNHIEVRLSQTNIQIWASDFSTDNGQTFPNFRLIGEAAIDLSFTTGYVHFQQEERAPAKYAEGFGISPAYANNYWSNPGFDGPVLAADTGFQVADPLTSGPHGALNLGYGLLTNPNSTYTCCPQTTVEPLSLDNVDLAGVSMAKLTFDVFYTPLDGTPTSASTINLQYRLNGGTWQASNVDHVKALNGGAWQADSARWTVAYAESVAVSELRSGVNTLEIKTDGTLNSYPPILSNVELLTIRPSR